MALIDLTNAFHTVHTAQRHPVGNPFKMWLSSQIYCQ